MRSALSLVLALAAPLALAACNGLGAQSSSESGSTSTSGGESESASASASASAGESESESGAETCTLSAIECHRAELLIATDELAADLAGERTILDLRSAAEHEAGHVPGAVFLDPSSIRATVDGVSGQIADQATLEAVLGAVGVSADRPVVAYDDGTAQAASRLAWTLRYHGKLDVRVLDGGFGAWSADGHEVEVGATSPVAATLALAAGDPLLRVDAAWVEAHLGDPAVKLVDARTVGEYEAGHIPGALQIPWQDTKAADDRFLADAPLRALYEGAGVLAADTVIAYCQTGTRASPTWLSLMLLDHPDVRLYDGSWAEWGADPNLPKEP
ncbi:MAG: sulfurtransferase [Myxococcales bacterium]|nr:sulfurtransferase [Myxococcales bacterium]